MHEQKKNKTGIFTRIFRDKKTYLILLVVLLVMALFDYIRMLLFDDQKSFRLFITSHIVSIIFVVLLIIQLLWLREDEQTSASVKQRPSQNLKPAKAIISFICSLIPLPLLIYCLIVSGGSGKENGPGAVWWIFVIYATTAGIPVFLLWLICGIKGLNTNMRKLALTSLIIKPVADLIIVVLLTILDH